MKEEERKKKHFDGRRRTKSNMRWVSVLLFCSFFLLSSSFSPAFSQPVFRVVPSVEATLEGGDVNILVVRTDNENFQLRVPKSTART